MFDILIRYQSNKQKDIKLHGVIPGQTILEILLDNGIDWPHECGGVCACSTCHLWIEEGMHHLEEKGRREIAMLQKTQERKNGSRLACQAVLTDERGSVTIVLPAHPQPSVL